MLDAAYGWAAFVFHFLLLAGWLFRLDLSLATLAVLGCRLWHLLILRLWQNHIVHLLWCCLLCHLLVRLLFVHWLLNLFHFLFNLLLDLSKCLIISLLNFFNNDYLNVLNINFLFFFNLFIVIFSLNFLFLLFFILNFPYFNIASEMLLLFNWCKSIQLEQTGIRLWFSRPCLTLLRYNF